MKRIFLFLSAVAAALALPSCLQNETTIHLNKDGSGTLVEQTTFGVQFLQMMDQMAGLGGDAAPKDPVADMFTEEKGKEQASKMGEGVTFVSTEPVKTTAGGRGAKMTFKFADINKLKLSPTDALKNASPQGDAPEEKESKPIGFAYSGNTLTLSMPEPEKKPEAPTDGPDMDNPQAQEMMKKMMGDMKISLKIVADGGIAETDASFHDDKSVTLMEMDMAKVIANPDAFKKLTATSHDDPQTAMEALKGVDGVKSETKKQIKITLK